MKADDLHEAEAEASTLTYRCHSEGTGIISQVDRAVDGFYQKWMTNIHSFIHSFITYPLNIHLLFRIKCYFFENSFNF